MKTLIITWKKGDIFVIQELRCDVMSAFYLHLFMCVVSYCFIFMSSKYLCISCDTSLDLCPAPHVMLKEHDMQ